MPMTLKTWALIAESTIWLCSAPGKLWKLDATELNASGQEAAAIRNMVGDSLLIVSPGIRPDGSPIGDQKRTTTPKQAIEAGADYLVVGRPILGSDNRGMAAEAILRDIEAALAR